MKPIQRNEILGLGEYEAIRPHFRARVIEEKKQRRVALGPRATALFENRDTVLLQIQEMLRTERITRDAGIQHEIDTYNAFVPGARELSCTVMIEIDEKEEREKLLLEARGIEDAFTVTCGGETCAGKTTPDRLLPDRASAVIYLKFALGERAVAALKKGETAELAVEHAAYRARVVLPPALVRALGEDLE
ncbi:MAG TPA: DUF3501 family protein [Polyangiaceae bacterium]|jgi:hypothetical protein